MPTQQFAVQYTIDRNVMCEAAPMAMEELTRELVRTVSPDWSTVRLEIGAGFAHTWVVRLQGEGVPRPGGDHG